MKKLYKDNVKINSKKKKLSKKSKHKKTEPEDDYFIFAQQNGKASAN